MTMARTLMPTPTLHTTMAELLAGWPAARAVVGRRGMACVGCAMARFETIAEAAEAYGFDAGQFLHEVNHAKAGDRVSRSRPPAARWSRQNSKRPPNRT